MVATLQVINKSSKPDHPSYWLEVKNSEGAIDICLEDRPPPTFKRILQASEAQGIHAATAALSDAFSSVRARLALALGPQYEKNNIDTLVDEVLASREHARSAIAQAVAIASEVLNISADSAGQHTITELVQRLAEAMLRWKQVAEKNNELYQESIQQCSVVEESNAKKADEVDRIKKDLERRDIEIEILNGLLIKTLRGEC